MSKEKVIISARIDKDVKEQFESVCESMGMKVTDAINIFVREVIREQGSPFEVKLKSVDSLMIKK